MPARSPLAILLLAFMASAAEAQPLMLDSPTDTGGIEAVCTGVSLDAREDPRWFAYSLKLEFAGTAGRYLGGEAVVVRQAGKAIFSGSCNGPWLLLRLPAGRYEVEARLDGEIASSSAIVPATGQARIVLRFGEATGKSP